MLVSANKQTLMTPIPKKPGEDPTAEAAAGLQGAMLQTLQSNVQAQTAQVQKSATQNATQQVSEANKISDNVDEAFAKTRVGLQLTYAPLPADVQGKFKGGTATDAFKEYMSKTPEERIQDAILEEMGLTKEEVAQMPPEQQQAVAKEIAERMQDKIKLAEAEKNSGNGEHGSSQVADKLLAAL
ncbi:hypothetical protein PS662_00717 [Pseudomonas fluorescens]|uniref:Uncharacterized protein n=1 Tax=Pseudomonas fluorescens TaxID=294 RepID=A0A5E6PZT9_PSEFL|nr:hypothetical protein [Pseudomonas fluorescens]VVM49376.1 hypothetical protein PS662_00717 [Pseudomonas fluorescens]